MTNLGRRTKSAATAVVLGLALLAAGCRSAQDQANDAAVAQAKQQAAATGVAQRVVYTDKNGDTVTTIVQPPAPGQTTQQVTVTKTTSTTTNTTAKTPVASNAQPTTAAVSPNTPAVAGGGAAASAYGPAPATAYGARAAAPPAAYAGNALQPSAGSVVTSPVEVQVPAGTNLAIRINQRISVKTWRAGDRFTGEVVHEVMSGNSVAIPSGTHVNGVVDAAHRRGHFKGRSILGLRLTSMQMNGQRYSLDTRDNMRTKKGKGKRSAAFIGGGTGAGMLIGGLATGGVGLVVGGLIGAGGGTALGGLTGNRDLVIPAESVVNFRLADDLVVTPQ